jgi:hypothetical protein
MPDCRLGNVAHGINYINDEYEQIICSRILFQNFSKNAMYIAMHWRSLIFEGFMPTVGPIIFKPHRFSRLLRDIP